MFKNISIIVFLAAIISGCNDDGGGGSPVIDLIKSQSEKMVDLQVQLVKLSEQLEKLQAVVVDNSKANEDYKELVELMKNQSTKDSQKIAELQAQLEKFQAVVKKQNTFVGGKAFRDQLKDGSFAPEMVMIAAGSFRMGDINAQPVHDVSVGQFAMGKFEVTFAEYDKFVDATGREKPSDQGWGRGNRPVINVSWNEATAYTKWLSNQTGKQYRLPTEAEWEYAARAGTDTKYWWGNDIDKSKANYNNNIKKTSPVGNYNANKFGLYDTSENVWEWTCSEFTDKYNGKEKQCVTTANSLSFRGGSLDSDAGVVRSAYRNWGRPTGRYFGVGFRVSRIVTL
jgi:formylglycine-generating enzyme required for sulfatase activity